MKIYGYSFGGDAELSELHEVSFVASPEELRRIARFLEDCAAGMAACGGDWMHEHLSDNVQGFKGTPDVVVVNPVHHP
ncbi:MULTISPECIES: Imm32 family immunity protein [Pandoraea]|uniref:Imm32 family immunity protein n=1 Tax=Pandoraea TaxID=93217 RepID=UPI00124272AC|nr:MULTISPECIES: 3-deoxy-7-phosphoheptulonate synthase [Pandoraea]